MNKDEWMRTGEQRVDKEIRVGNVTNSATLYKDLVSLTLRQTVKKKSLQNITQSFILVAFQPKNLVIVQQKSVY